MGIQRQLVILICLMVESALINSWSYNPICYFSECCNSDDIPADINGNCNNLLTTGWFYYCIYLVSKHIQNLEQNQVHISNE